MSVVPGRYAREVEGCTGINQHSKAENVKHFQRILGLMRQGMYYMEDITLRIDEAIHKACMLFLLVVVYIYVYAVLATLSAMYAINLKPCVVI